MRGFILAATLGGLLLSGGEVFAEDPWFKTCNAKPVPPRFSLNDCMKESGTVYSIIGTNGCLLSTGDLSAATARSGVIKGTLTCDATDYARITYAHLWVAQFDKANAAQLQSLAVTVASPRGDEGIIKYDNKDNFEFSRGKGLYWSYRTGQPFGLLENWSLPNAVAGTINGDPYSTVMEFPKFNGRSGQPKAILLSKAEKSPQDYGAAVILGRGFISPVSLDTLYSTAGKSRKLSPYDVLRRTVAVSAEERAALGNREKDHGSPLDPNLYGKAVISRSLFRLGNKPRFVKLGGGVSDVMNLSLGLPSEMRVHDDEGLFRLSLLSGMSDAPPPNLFSTDPAYSDIALSYSTAAGTILLEPLVDGLVRLYILSKGSDGESHPKDSPAAKAQAAGYKLRALCEENVDSSKMVHCSEGKAGTVFRLSYVTDRTHR